MIISESKTMLTIILFNFVVISDNFWSEFHSQKQVLWHYEGEKKYPWQRYFLEPKTDRNKTETGATGSAPTDGADVCKWWRFEGQGKIKK